MFRSFMTALMLVIAVSGTVGLAGQAQGPGQTFQFVVGAVDKAGSPVTDLKPEEVVMSEKAGRAKVTKLEPFSLPTKVTITVDNGQDSADAIQHYRAGLKGFVDAFPEGVEMTLISTAPQPRTVLRPTTDRAQILRAINGFAPENNRPRFTDALVEISQRLQKEAKDPNVKPYVPLILMISTATNEVSDYQPSEVGKAADFLVARRAKLYVTITSTKSNDVTAAADLNTNRQAMVAIPFTKALNGRFETLAIANRLQTLLPEFGKELADYHKRLTSQFLVTVERAAAGPMEDLRIELAREGLAGNVSLDGYFALPDRTAK